MNEKTTLFITPGETGDWIVELFQADGTTPGKAEDVAEAWFTVKAAREEDPGVVQLTRGENEIRATSVTNELRVVMPSDKSAALGDGKRYAWDMRLRMADGTVSNPATLSGTLVTNRRATFSR